MLGDLCAGIPCGESPLSRDGRCVPWLGHTVNGQAMVRVPLPGSDERRFTEVSFMLVVFFGDIEEWQRLWDSRPSECPICYDDAVDIWDGPMNSDVPTRCTHWLCTQCWMKVSEDKKRCPLCRDDLSEWLDGYDY